MGNNSRINIKSGETCWPSHQNYIKKLQNWHLTLGLKQANALPTFDAIITHFFNTGYSRHHQNLRHSPGGHCHSYIREDRRPWRRWGTSDWRLLSDGVVMSHSSTWHTVEHSFQPSVCRQASWHWRSSSAGPGSIPTSWRCSPRWWISPTSWKSSSAGSRRKPSTEQRTRLGGVGAGRRVWAQRMESRVPSNTATPRTVLYLTGGPCARLTLAAKEAEEPCSAVCLSSYSSGYFH